MGKGFSAYGMQEIIRIGFEELGLNLIYWYVAQENSRAIRFYDKNGYKRIEKSTLQKLIGGGTDSLRAAIIFGTKKSGKEEASPLNFCQYTATEYKNPSSFEKVI